MSKDSVRLIGAGLRIGDTADNEECPFCQVRHERKFSVTRVDGGLLYNCYRAKCGESGFVPEVGSWERRTKPDVPVHRPYLGKLYPASEEDEQWFLSTWGVLPSHLRVADSGHFAFPLLSPLGEVRGWVLRNPVWSGRDGCPRCVVDGPKSLTYKNRAEDPALSWTGKYRKLLVLCEDYVSASKISLTGWTGVALNGVHLTYEGVKEIAAQAPLAVVIWLDPGAEQAAYCILNKWGMTFNFCCVIVGDKDPKDYTVEEIREKLGAVRW